MKKILSIGSIAVVFLLVSMSFSSVVSADENQKINFRDILEKRNKFDLWDWLENLIIGFILTLAVDISFMWWILDFFI